MEGGVFRTAIEHRRDRKIAERDHGRARDADRLAVDETEEGQRGAGEPEGRGLLELAVDDEDGDRGHHDAGQDRAAAQDLETVIYHAVLAELVEPDRGRAG